MISLSRFFGTVKKSAGLYKKNRDKNTSPIYAPGTRILYDPELVSKLKQDHASLVSVYTDITNAIEQQDSKKVKAYLDIFLSIFNAHALTEYTKLYVFLDYTFRGERKTHDLVMRFRQEMNDIGKAVRRFAHAWQKKGIDLENLEDFKIQKEKIGKVLTKRIEVEENQLYQIYASAPSHFNELGIIAH